jgi:hypothetical protein
MTTDDDYRRRVTHLEKLGPSQMLAELLAVIHGDGGQYAEQHGFAKAVADAEVKWCAPVEPPPFDDDWAPNPNDDHGTAGVVGGLVVNANGVAPCSHDWHRDKNHPRHWLCAKCGTARDGRLGDPYGR